MFREHQMLERGHLMVSMSAKKKQTKQEKFDDISTPKLKFKEKLSYGLGDLGNGLMFDLGHR